MLAISNLAWDNVESEKYFDTFKKIGINKIECVLTKIKDWGGLTLEDIIDYKNHLNKENIQPYSIQSLFYNIKCDSFKDDDLTMSHFIRLIEYSKILGVKILVLGSPNLRKKYDNWETEVVNLFKKVDGLLDNTGIVLTIEPNASEYGGQYFTKISEIVEFIKNSKFSNIKTMIDTHNLILENCDPTIEFIKHNDYISHIHVSEIGLAPIIKTETHELFSKKLMEFGYDGVITYETKKDDKFIESLEVFNGLYKNKKI
jgi:D-psicose/D-tagatose/L-ribulose 3-epimerase